jgi:hypothetical protein
MSTHFSDGIAVGTAGYPPNPNNPGSIGRGSAFATAGPGVVASPTVIYRLAALPTASSTNLAAATTYSGAAAFPVTLVAGTGVTQTTLFGTTVYDIVGQFGERSIRAVAAGGAGGAGANTVTFAGYDMYEVPVTGSFAGATSGNTVESNKTLRYLTSISVTGSATGSGVSFGVGDKIGFPVRVNNASDFMVTNSGVLITANSTGFVAADTTVPATASTNNVRGSYTLQAATNAANVQTFWINPIDVNTTSGAYGVVQA